MRWFLGLILMLLFDACVPAIKLAPGEKLLYKQNIKGNKYFQTDELEPFFRQKPNRRLLFLPITPYLYAYQIGKEIHDLTQEDDKIILDSLSNEYKFQREALQFESGKKRKKAEKQLKKLSKKIVKAQELYEKGNWLMRSVGEPPAIIDTAKTFYVASQMQQYMQQNGFFSAKVSPQFVVTGTLETIHYLVKEGQPHKVKNVFYLSEDANIQKIIQTDSLNRKIKKGDIYKDAALGMERERLLKQLQNNGYFSFGQQYIFVEVDTFTQEKNTLDLTFRIETPKKNKHKTYTLTDVVFKADEKRDTANVMQDFYENVHFTFYNKKFTPKILSERISFAKDSLFSFQEIANTQKNLLDLNIFKFANIYFDTLGNKLIPKISVTSFPKYDATVEAGVNLVRFIPGPFVSLGLTNRNFLGSCELMNIQARGLLEYTLDNQDGKSVYRWAHEISAVGTLTIPKFLLPISKNTRLKLYKYNPQTQFLVGFTRINRPQYIRNNLNAVLRYNWTYNKYSDFRLNLVDFSLNFTDYISTPFFNYLQSLWKKGNNLVYSFQSSLVAAVSGQYLFSNNRSNNIRKSSDYLNLSGEVGVSYASDILSQIDNFNPEMFKERSLKPLPFIRLQLDGRRYRLISKKTILAARAHLGLTLPLGKQKNLVGIPYQKYQFLGGSNSVRAWTQRRLGTGSMQLLDSAGKIDYTLERPGELLFETSFEVRRKVAKLIELAAFIDAGNVWMLTQSVGEGSLFDANRFYKEIAVGTGVGLRLDFSFLVLRMDYALKIYDPAQALGARWTIRDFRFGNPFSPNSGSNLNIGIGYPF